MGRREGLLITLLVVGICAWPFVEYFNKRVSRVPVPYETLEAMAIETLEDINAQSIAENREYCAVITYNEDNQPTVLGPLPGERASCTTFRSISMRSLAMIHTHGGFDLDYDTERPSDVDIKNARQQEHDSFVGTPGGRVWHIDGRSGIATIIRDAFFLPSDQRYPDSYPDPISPMTASR